MGTIATEAGVLKLVLPGRRVEHHQVPVTAAEVMRRYPRHSITRPDIFEFPWIVVKPEAILTPGRVFFIVPNRTIYQLLKSKENSDSDRSSSASQQQQGESPKDHAPQQEQKVSRKTSSNAGMTPMHQENRKRLKHQFLAMSCSTTVCPSEDVQDLDVREVRRHVQRGSGPVLLDKYKTAQGEPKPKPSSLSSKKETRKGKGKASISSITEKISDLKFTASKQLPKLKTCIRKPESSRKLLQLRVRFVLPNNYVEQQSKAADYRKQYPGYGY